MATCKPRGRPREFDRGEALGAALKVFQTLGYEGASVSDLCAAMNICPPSLYAAFGNKSALFLEALNLEEATRWREPANALMAEADARKAVAAYFERAAEIFAAGPSLSATLPFLSPRAASAEKEIAAAIAALRADRAKMFAERLRAAIAAGQIPMDADAPALAGALAAMLDGLAIKAREGPFLSELKAMAACAPLLLPPVCQPAMPLPEQQPAPSMQTAPTPGARPAKKRSRPPRLRKREKADCS